MRKPLFVVTLATACVAASVAAQTPLPGLENFTLERPQPTPTPTPTQAPTVPPTGAPTPAPTATPAPPPSPVASPTVAPRSTPTATPSARETPRPTATAPASAAPTATTTPAATPSPQSTSLPTDEAADSIDNGMAPPVATDEPAAASTNWALWAALAGLLVVGLGAFAWWRRRGGDDFIEETPAQPARGIASTTDRPVVQPQESAPLPAPVSPAPLAPAAPAPASPPLPGGRITSSLKAGGGGGLVTSTMSPELRVALAPLRGGVDTLRATVEYELQIGNAGRGTARGVSVETWLTSASHQTAEDLARLFSSPAGQPMLAPFDLTPNAAIDLAGVGTVVRDALATITAGDRRMFVPVLAVRIGYFDGRGSPQNLTTAFLVGIERAGQDRLAPLPLDRGARMHDRLGARPYGN